MNEKKIEYKETKDFTKEDIKDLFLSVNWLSGKYPDRLVKALKASPTVITAWDGEKLVGLIRILDDGEMTAFLHYLLVNPSYQGCGIAKELLTRIKQLYKDYLYINIMPEESCNAAFYQKHGFSILEDGIAMQKKQL